MLVIGLVADVADVGICSEGDGESTGVDERKERQARRVISVHVVSCCVCMWKLCTTHQQNGQVGAVRHAEQCQQLQ
jgi:hypothetical protein